MGLPAYPPDWAGTWNNVQQQLKAAYTGAQSRVRYAAIRAAALVLGQQTGGRIEIDPAGGIGGAPAITFHPQTGAKIATLQATSSGYPDEVTVLLRGSANNAGTVWTQIVMGGGIVEAQVCDATSGAVVRSCEIAEDYASIGGPSGTAYAYVDDSDAWLAAGTGGTCNLSSNGGSIVVGSDGGIGIYAATSKGAWLEMSPSGTVNKGGSGW